MANANTVSMSRKRSINFHANLTTKGKSCTASNKQTKKNKISYKYAIQFNTIQYENNYNLLCLVGWLANSMTEIRTVCLLTQQK